MYVCTNHLCVSCIQVMIINVVKENALTKSKRIERKRHKIYWKGTKGRRRWGKEEEGEES